MRHTQFYMLTMMVKNGKHDLERPKILCHMKVPWFQECSAFVTTHMYPVHYIQDTHYIEKTA